MAKDNDDWITSMFTKSSCEWTTRPTKNQIERVSNLNRLCSPPFSPRIKHKQHRFLEPKQAFAKQMHYRQYYSCWLVGRVESL